MYPPALLKNSQLPIHHSALSGFDIVADFNAMMPFFFLNSPGTIQPNQFDFEYVLVHELTHGLGFLSGQISWYTFYPQYVNSYNVFEPQVTIDNNQVSGYTPFYIFDSFLYNKVTGKFLLEDFRTTHDEFVPGQALMDFFTGYATSKAYPRANGAYLAVTTGDIVFNSKYVVDGTGVPVYCPNIYLYGSSVSHLDYSPYAKSPDFLMTYSIGTYQGVRLDDAIARNQGLGQSFGVYGPGILNILKSMGWGSPYTSTSNGLVGTFTKDSSSGVVRNGVGFMVLVGLIVSCLL